MNWLVTFTDHREKWLDAAAIVSTDLDITASEAVRRAIKFLEGKFPLDDYKKVTATQVVA